MIDPYAGLVIVPKGPGALERAYYEAVQKFGLSIELNQVGWDGDNETFEVIEWAEA